MSGYHEVERPFRGQLAGWAGQSANQIGALEQSSGFSPIEPELPPYLLFL